MDQNAKLSPYFSKEKILPIGIIIFGLLTNLLIIWIPTLQGQLIDRVSRGATGLFILQPILMFVGLVALVQLFRFFKRYLVRKFENRTIMAIRQTIYHNIMASSIEEISDETAGSLMNKILADVSIVSEGLRKIITEIFDTGVMLLGYLVLMTLSDFRLTFLSVMFIPAAVVLSKLLQSTVARYNREYREAKSDLNNSIYQNITHAMLFRGYGLQAEFNQAFKNELPGIRQKAIRAAFLDTGLEPLYNVIALAGVFFCIYCGSSNIERGLWTIGQFTSFLIMYTAVAAKSGKISAYLNLWQKTAVSWQRLQDQLRPVTSEKIEPPEPVSFTKPLCLKFAQVSFSYDRSKHPLLNNLNFEASTGEIIGICGPIAAGKSTLLRLLTTENRYQGQITVNGLDLSTLDTKQKNSIIAVKNHEAELFSGTIAENIAFDSGLDLNEVLNDTRLSEDIHAMPAGIQTLIGNRGTTLSGGQKDRMALARALQGHKGIILLDDPFAAVDGDTESQIIQNLRKNYSSSILLITSHRLTLFPYVDKTIFLDGQGGFQLGSHQELLKSNRLYAQAYHIQRGVTG